MDRCGSCGVEILWCKDATGRLVPLDIEPHKRGRYAIVDTGLVREIGEDERWAGPRFKAHTYMCTGRSRQRAREGRHNE